ncbi:MAG: hypothetical protein ACI9U0_002299 [Flavobacteriales bacterium]|jgi:hypothetical protein|tara:strand:- start:17648 stop:18511 length:864 start_codon:yes stop_codon:yes gene_type:complete
MRKLIIIPVLIFLLGSCKKDNIEYISGNTPPPDFTVETVVKENYVNKLYISILGRQATDIEYSEGLELVNKSDLSEAGRLELISSIMDKEDYFHNEYETIREDLLNGVDTSEVTKYRNILVNLKERTNDQDLINSYDSLIKNLDLIHGIIPGLENAAFNFVEVQRRCVDNYLYDKLNMGSENFVVSIYQNFLFRYPTSEETISAVDMVDGNQNIVNFEIGRSKRDFLKIFFSSDEYFEGQVRTAFIRFLFREPNVEELFHMKGLYRADLEFKSMQKRILILDEYVGI